MTKARTDPVRKSIWKGPWRVICPGFIISVFFCHFGVAAQEFSATGVFHSEAFFPQYKTGKEPVLVMEGEFSVDVKGCESQVRYGVTNVVYHASQFKSEEAGAVLAFDGTNYYQLSIQNTNLPISAKAITSGKIGSGLVPERVDERLATLWMAFGSHCYFRNADSNLIDSPFMNPPDERAIWAGDHRVRAIWSVLPGFPGLPAYIVHSPTFASQNSSTTVASNIFFKVLATTNFEGLVLPKNFEYKLYFPLDTLLDTFSGELKSVRSGTTLQDFAPSLPKRTYIIDERFIGRPGNPVPEYIHSSSNWPTLKEGETNLSKSLSPITNSGKLDSDKSHQNHAIRVVTLAVLGLLTLIPVTLFLKQNRNKKERQR